eukprot:6490661-Amphidinium_carterae.4
MRPLRQRSGMSYGDMLALQCSLPVTLELGLSVASADNYADEPSRSATLHGLPVQLGLWPSWLRIPVLASSRGNFSSSVCPHRKGVKLSSTTTCSLASAEDCAMVCCVLEFVAIVTRAKMLTLHAVQLIRSDLIVFGTVG